MKSNASIPAFVLGSALRSTRTAKVLACLLVTAVSANICSATVWNLDTTKTRSVWANVASNPATYTTSPDPIDLGAWGNDGYLVIPYFTFNTTGYASGASIASVDSFQITLSALTFPVAGENAFNADLYLWLGSGGNPDIASTGNVTTADWNFPALVNAGTATLLQTSFIASTSVAGTFTLDETGRSAILSYLQNNYVSGNYMTFTLRMSQQITGSDGLMRFGGLTGSIETTAIPEPSSYAAILGLASFGVMACRRNRKPR